MAQPPHAQKPILTKEQLKKKLEVSNFDPNAILRGAQLTVVGGKFMLYVFTILYLLISSSSESIAESSPVYIGTL